MSDEKCAVEVWDGWRSRVCNRPIKRDGMCGLHAAAKERREKNALEREQKYAERRRLDQERADRRAAGEEAISAVERVRALADQWEKWDAYAQFNYGETTDGPAYAKALRAALEPPTADPAPNTAAGGVADVTTGGK